MNANGLWEIVNDNNTTEQERTGMDDYIWVTILDTKTGKTKTIDDKREVQGAFYWAEGSGSCDCNRAPALGCEEEIEREMRDKYPELEGHQMYCFGEKRFLIIATSPCEYTLEEMNDGYPQELVDKYIKQGHDG